MRNLMIGLTGAAALLASPAIAAGRVATVSEVATSLAPNRFVWGGADEVMADGAVQIVISITDQRAYVYQGDTLIAASAVSTGRGDKPTPLGSFQILQKNIDHKSNLYDAAPMPYMQRLTWDGVAIHAGRNPGFPASHGCIRVPAAFAKKLFDVTQLGTTVTVTDESIGDPESYVPPVPLDVLARQETESANRQALAAIGG